MLSETVTPLMQIHKSPITRTCEETEIFNGLFDFTNKHILELGCGAAFFTRVIAEGNPSCRIDGLEVDEIQHNKNLQIKNLPNVIFKRSGAENIPAAENTYDIVFMFKSLHHVPSEHIDQAIQEIHRVLKPNGHAYISEPLFAGEYNNLIKLFNNEKNERELAFRSLQKAVHNGIFRLQAEIFFNTLKYFKNFYQFQKNVIEASFHNHHMDKNTYQRVRHIFQKKMKQSGARFYAPYRVDLFKKTNTNRYCFNYKTMGVN